MGKLLENIASDVRERLWKDNSIAGKVYREFRHVAQALEFRRAAPYILRALSDGRPRTIDEIHEVLKEQMSPRRYEWWDRKVYTDEIIAGLGDVNLVDIGPSKEVNEKATVTYLLTPLGLEKAERFLQKKSVRRLR
jgi:hypothetical protein